MMQYNTLLEIVKWFLPERMDLNKHFFLRINPVVGVK